MAAPDYVEEKIAFAEALIKCSNNAFEAASLVFPDTGQALQIARFWVNDPIVNKAKIEFLATNGLRAYLPTKEEQARDIYAMAQDIKLDVESRLKAHRLYAEVMSHIEKPLPGNAVNMQFNSVMVVRSHGDDKEWEQNAKDQQRRLILAATQSDATSAN